MANVDRPDALRRNVQRVARLVATVLIATTAHAVASGGERLTPRPLGLDVPAHMDSAVQGRVLRGEAWSVLPVAFETVARELEQPKTWCDIAVLHMNVKACVHERDGNDERIEVYLGYRVFQTPEQAHALEATLDVRRQPDRLIARLDAARGPYGTSDYELSVIATPHGSTHTRLDFAYRQRFSWFARNAMRLFLSTWARDQIGFTRLGPKKWVKGFEGLMERNFARYQLAIQAYLEHPEDGSNAHREARWRRWFDLTERHAAQLHIVERAAYLETMRREDDERARLQARLAEQEIAAMPWLAPARSSPDGRERASAADSGGLCARRDSAQPTRGCDHE